MSGDRNLANWAGDLSLYHRLRESVHVLARGKGTWNDRATSIFLRMAPIRPADFPAMLQPVFENVRILHERSILRFSEDRTMIAAGSMPPKHRDILTRSILNLYEEMLKERVRQGLED